jgi:hypothetical protein
VIVRDGAVAGLVNNADLPGAPADNAALPGMSLPGANRLAGFLFWLVFPALSVTAIVFAVLTLSDHLGQPSAAVHGEYTVTYRGCSDHLCKVTGTFVSDSSLDVFVGLPGDPRWLQGKTYASYFVSNNGDVQTVAGTWDPTTTILALTGASIYLLTVGALALRSVFTQPGDRVRLS